MAHAAGSIARSARLRDQQLSALALMHQALVDIALLPKSDVVLVARTALKQLALNHPEVVEILLARAAGSEFGSKGEQS